MIPYGKHVIDDSDIECVVDTLKNRFLTQGAMVPNFEKSLSQYCQAKYAVAVNSGTSALHIACLTLGVGKGDIVWTSPISFVASANCALYCGGSVDFVDIDPVTRNISVVMLEEKLREAKLSNTMPKVLIVVHYSGLSCNMQAISALARSYGVLIIEDACHALGGQYQGKPVGNCLYSDLVVMSFHPVKSITTAEGGAVLCDNQDYKKKLSLFASHGVTRDLDLMDVVTDDARFESPWYYQQIELGYNYRMSDLHAALGLSQLTKLDNFIEKRNSCANYYFENLTNLPIKLPMKTKEDNSAWHIFTIELTQHDRRQVFNMLRTRGVGVNVHYIPIHLQPFYQKLGFKLGDFPNAERFYEAALTLPLYPSLKESEQLKVVDILNEALL